MIRTKIVAREKERSPDSTIQRKKVKAVILYDVSRKRW